MRQTPARQLLDGWETFRSEPMPLRAAALASLLTGRRLRDVMRWSVARRDQALFDFRARMFGDRIDAVTACPSCAAQLEMQIPLAQIAPRGSITSRSVFRTVQIGGKRIRCRPPNTEDLLAVASLNDVSEARTKLIARCVQTRDPDLRERAAAVLTNEANDVQLDLTCPACGHTWPAPFDIAAFVWRELDDWAQQTLHDIHLIASAYGWSEHQILQLSARRRQIYVEMI
jgi:hypothetical protein